MATRKRKPDVQDLYELAQSLKDENAKRDALYDRLDALYDQVRDTGDDDSGTEATGEAQIVQMPYATNVVDLGADLASDLEVSIEVPAEKETVSAKNLADDQEKWLRGWLGQNERIQNRNLTRDAAWFAIQRSLVAMRVIFTDKLLTKAQDSEDGEDGESKGKGKKYALRSVPVLLQVPDPRYIYIAEGAAGPECVVESFDRSVADIRRMYPGVLADKEEYPGERQVEWCEYWDDTYRVYWADGIPIKFSGQEVVPHGYGCLPYSFGVARSTPRPAPDKRHRPLLASVERTLKNIDTWFSILTTAGWDTVTSAFNVYSDNYSDSEGGKKIHTEPGAVNYLSPTDKVEPLQRAPLPADFFQLGNMLLQAFQQGTFPFALYGQQSGAMAGYAINMMIQSGRRPLVPVLSAVRQAYEGAFANALTICREKVAPLLDTDEISIIVAGQGEIEHARRSVAHSLKLDTTKITPGFSCMVRLDDPMPADEASNSRLALELTKGGLLSRETALTKFKLVPDALDELTRIEIDKLFVQLAAKSLAKVAAERGYIPSEAIPPELSGQQQGQPQQPGPQQMQPQGMPQGLPQQGPTPEQMAMLQAMMQGQGQGQPGMMPQGMPPELLQAMMQQGGPDAAGLQQMAGQPQQPTLDQMAGVPPVLPAQLGGM